MPGLMRQPRCPRHQCGMVARWDPARQAQVYFCASCAHEDLVARQQERIAAEQRADAETREAMADTWGPELCRVEYLEHLVKTGRVKPDV